MWINGKAMLEKRIDREPKATNDWLDKLDRRELIPQCLDESGYYEFQFSDGFLLPCACSNTYKEMFHDSLLEDLYKDELNFDTGISIDEIMLSPEWDNFLQHLFAGEEYAPAICIALCGRSDKVKNLIKRDD